jgi:TRPM family ion channel
VIFERPAGPDDVGRAVAALGLGGPRPVLTLVGGAGGMDGQTRDQLATLFSTVIAPAVARHGAAAVDGGTDNGVMRLLGRARAGFPLVGVVAEGTVEFPGNTPRIDDFGHLDAHHTHFVVVPGDVWGAESPYIPLVAAALAGGAPRVTVLVNGGDITLIDALLAIEHRTPLLVLRGTGRLADEIAAAADDPAGRGDEGIARLALSDLVRVVPVDNRTELAAQLERYLTG